MKNEMQIILVAFDNKSFQLSGQLVGEIDSYIDANYIRWNRNGGYSNQLSYRSQRTENGVDYDAETYEKCLRCGKEENSADQKHISHDIHYANFVKCIAEGKTCSDWNTDFVEEYMQEIADYEKFNPVYVWYAAYGSNISEKRLMKYINSCTDKSAPIKSRNYIFSHNIYFDRASRRWNGAVAILDMKSEGKTYGKMHLIKKTQLEEIQKMEGSAYSKRELLGFVKLRCVEV